MEIGRCPSCSRPYSAAEVAGVGILRPRFARDGGPLVEYRCPGCSKPIVLVPHGGGRYAPPGQPPPAEVPVEERTPAWAARGDGGPRAESPPRAPPPGRAAPPGSPERPGTAGRAAPEDVAPPPHEPDGEIEAIRTDDDARAVLGVGPDATRGEIESAFRQRSRQCHPDKVAHLDPEFQALAQRKFLLLRRAYERLHA
jgi:hypothetical protein